MSSETIKQCPICQQAVESDSTVCSGCGYSLLITCAGCHTPMQLSYTYCPHCGRPVQIGEIPPTYQELQALNEKNRTQLMEYARDVTKLYMQQRRLEQYLPTGLLDKVLVSGSQVVGERRYLTVLFSDVVGFTQLSNALDPEEVFVLMNDCFRLLVEQVYKYGGSVDKFIGDALMVLFGAPISYGNDSERAVRAAIAMQQAMDEFNRLMEEKLNSPLELRIGITSGEVIAGTVGVEGQWSYTVMGSTVNMASRLQSAAEPGGILVNEDIYLSTKGLFNFNILRPIALKGIGDAVAVFEVMSEIEEISHFQQLPLSQLSPFVGRQAELEALNRFMARLLPKQGGLVVINSEAGLGKTRLMWEWQAQFSEDIQIWAGYAKNLSQSSYQLWQGLILRGLNLHQEGPQTVTEILLNHLGDKTWLPYLQNLLFEDLIENEPLALLSPEQIKQQTFVAVGHLLSRLAQNAPLVIFLDDLQWIDQLSAELLEAVLPLCLNNQIIFCLGSRPHNNRALTLAISRAEQIMKEDVFHLNLSPLSDEDSRTLLQQKLLLDEIPPELQSYILERAQNNPYFLEELITFIANSGYLEKQNGKWHITNLRALMSLSLPGTLRGLVRAQIDHLSEAARQVLSYGAVIGSIFPLSLLRLALKDQFRLSQIQGYLGQMVDWAILSSDGANYHFVHNSVHEIIYHSLLLNQRQQMHEQIGLALEARIDTAVFLDVDQLAYHFSASGNAIKAVPYLIEAGEKATQQIANDVALKYFAHALDLLPQAPQYAHKEEEIHTARGDIYMHKGEYDYALDCYHQALEVAEDPNQRADAYRLIAATWQRKGQTGKEQEWLERALREINQYQHEVTDLTRGRVYAGMALFSMHKANYAHAERWGLDAVKMLEQTGQLSDLARSLNALGGAYYFQQRWLEASQQVERAYQIQLQAGDKMGVARSLTNLGVLYRTDYQWDKAIEAYLKAIAMCKQMDTVETVLSNAHNNLAFVYLHKGEYDLAESHLQESLALKQKTATTFELAPTYNSLGLVRLYKGRLTEAESYLTQSIELCRAGNNQSSLGEASRYLAEIKLAQGDTISALSAVEEAIDLAKATKSRGNHGIALRILAQIQITDAQLESAWQSANASLKLLTKLKDVYETACTESVLAEIAFAQKDIKQARYYLAKARPILEKYKTGPAYKHLQALQNQLEMA